MSEPLHDLAVRRLAPYDRAVRKQKGRPDEPAKFVSWGSSDAPAARAPRELWKPDAVLVGVLLFVGEALVLLVAGFFIVGPSKSLTESACNSYWADRAHTTLIAIWVIVAIVVLPVLFALWRRWHVVAVLVTQLLLAAALLPITLPAHAHASSMAKRVENGLQGQVPADAPLYADCS